MTYQQQTGKSIQEDFKRFHEKNPHVYSAIKKEALKMIKTGAKVISIKRIGNDIRFDKYMMVSEPTLFNIEGEQRRFKINDAYLSRYNRLFIQEHPELSDRVETRRLRAV